MSRRQIVTLISVGQAHVGKVFIHKGAASECWRCEYFKVCVGNLESDRVYKIVKVRNKMLSCKPYETEMQVVEVVNAEIAAALSAKKAIKGAITTFQKSNCHDEECKYYVLCHPMGLKEGDRCKVLEVTEAFQCSQGFSLRTVILRWAPSS